MRIRHVAEYAAVKRACASEKSRDTFLVQVGKVLLVLVVPKLEILKEYVLLKCLKHLRNHFSCIRLKVKGESSDACHSDKVGEEAW